jgi:hypothetical protein
MVAKPASEINPGDRIRLASGREMTVTRIQQGLLGRDDLLSLIEDTADGWFAQGVRTTAELEVIRETERRLH